MLDLLDLEKQFVTPHIKPGGVVADFTMGNGHDTLYLARAVGETGRVYSFDIQPTALESTRRLLESEGVSNVELILDSHSNAASHIHEPICAGMFNLGWLPGGDKSITTLRETTLPAVDAALELVDHDGIILIAVYPGHAEGDAEGVEIERKLSELSKYKFCATKVRIVNSPTAPYFFAIEKK